MTLSYVLFLFLVHLGVGIIVTLVLVPRVAGVQFFRFNAGFAAVLLLAPKQGLTLKGLQEPNRNPGGGGGASGLGGG